MGGWRVLVKSCVCIQTRPFSFSTQLSLAEGVAVVKINRDSKRNTDFARNIKALVQ